MPNHPSPHTAVAMLLLHKQRRLTLELQDFDLYFDTILELLEETNNEKYRCRHSDVSPAPVRVSPADPSPVSDVDLGPFTDPSGGIEPTFT